jgi:hypothetical protein
MKLIKMGIEEMKIEDRAEFIIAVRDYKCEKREKWADGIDYTASDKSSGLNVLLRSIEPQHKSTFVSVDDVRNMMKTMKRKRCASGVLVGNRFTDAASQEMAKNNIQQVSDSYMPPVTPEKIILTINGCTDSLCRKKCGGIPLKESECKGRLKEGLCPVKSISDDAIFHFERGWTDLMKNDLRQLLTLDKSIKG